jgi:RNA polymerase sigma factor (sigma-70 family)
MADGVQPRGEDALRDRAIEELFAVHRIPLTRLAVLLGADDADDVVSEAFYQLYRRWRRLRSAEAAAGYLRSVVVNRTRMRIRHLQVIRRHVDRDVHDPSAAMSSEAMVVLRDDQRAVVSALVDLSSRQREALVLRYWMELRENEIADAMGISVGAVKTHVSRGMAALSRAMEERR